MIEKELVVFKREIEDKFVKSTINKEYKFPKREKLNESRNFATFDICHTM